MRATRRRSNKTYYLIDEMRQSATIQIQNQNFESVLSAKEHGKDHQNFPADRGAVQRCTRQSRIGERRRGHQNGVDHAILCESNITGWMSATMKVIVGPEHEARDDAPNQHDEYHGHGVHLGQVAQKPDLLFYNKFRQHRVHLCPPFMLQTGILNVNVTIELDILG